MKLSDRLRQLATTRQAPLELKSRIMAALDAEDLSRARVVPIRSRIGWRLVGGAALATAAAAIILTISGPNERVIAQPFVQQHLTALAPDSDFQGSDPVALATWFASQMGYPIHIPDITEAELRGGRVTTIGTVRTAAVIYVLNGERLTYLAMPTNAAGMNFDDVTTMASNGYHVAVWTEPEGPRAVVAAMPEEAIAAVAEECKHKAALRAL